MANGALALYIDGQSAGTATGPTTSLTGPLNIDFARIQRGGNYYAGSIDEVAVYSAVLSSATALDHFKAGKGSG